MSVLALGRLFALLGGGMSGSQPARPNKVLLVDADYRTSQRLAGLLAEDGFYVEVVRDGASAIARLSRAPAPNALVTELRTPLVDGAEVARYGRSQRHDLKIIVLTRYPNQLVPSAFGTPPLAVLTKPLEYHRLLELLRQSSTDPRSADESVRRAASPRC